MSVSVDFKREENFGPRYYFQTLLCLIVSPAAFFRRLPENLSWTKMVHFLLLSSIFHAAAGYTYYFNSTFSMLGILLINSIFMPLILGVFIYLGLNLSGAKIVSFSKVFMVCAFATGTVLIVSWIPKIQILTEIWKFIIIAVGLVQWCKISWKKSVFGIIISLALITMLLWSYSQI